MKRSPFFAMALLALAVVASGCSRKGSSSLSSNHKSTTSKVTPKVRSTNSTADSEAALKAAQEAEAKAKAAAEEAAAAAKKAKAEAEAKAKAAAEKAAAAAKKAKEEAEAKAKAAAQKASEQAVIVKEEKVKVVESKAATDESNRYHIIIGSFKQLTNARQQSQDAISKGFYPSIMENEEGMYRVAVFSSGTESSARKKIAELRKKYSEYVGMWLLIEKK